MQMTPVLKTSTDFWRWRREDEGLLFDKETYIQLAAVCMQVMVSLILE